MSDGTTDAVAEAFAQEARRHREEIDAGRVSRVLVEVRIGQDGGVRARPAKVGTRSLQSESGAE